MQKFINQIKQQALAVNSNNSFSDIGQVIAYDPTNRLIKAQIHSATDDDSAQSTGWIPICSPWVGNGWGMFPSVEIGDHVLIVYQKANAQNGVAVSAFFTDKNRPLPVNPGEFNLVHKNGSTLKLKNDGSVEINCTGEVKIGDVAGSLKKLLTETAAEIFNNHTHSGNVPVPEEKMESADMTQNLKAT